MGGSNGSLPTYLTFKKPNPCSIKKNGKIKFEIFILHKRDRLQNISPESVCVFYLISRGASVFLPSCSFPPQN